MRVASFIAFCLFSTGLVSAALAQETLPDFTQLNRCKMPIPSKCVACQEFADEAAKNLESLRVLAQSTAPKAWVCALEIMETVGVDPVALERLIENEDRGIRKRAIVLAGNTGQKGLAWKILKYAQMDVDNTEEAVLLNAIAALGNLKYKESMDFLLQMARDPRPKIQRAAMRSLGSFENNEIVKLLADTAQDTSVQMAVRTEAIRSLGQMQDNYARKVLARLLKKGDLEVKRGVISAISRSGDKRLGRMLIAYINEPGLELQVVTALGNHRDGKIAAALMTFAKDEEKDPDLRFKALVAAAKTGAKDALDPLLAELESRDGSRRKAAIQGLGWLAESKAVAPLYKLYKKADDTDRKLLMWAMRQCSKKALGSDKEVEEYLKNQ